MLRSLDRAQINRDCIHRSSNHDYYCFWCLLQRISKQLYQICKNYKIALSSLTVFLLFFIYFDLNHEAPTAYILRSAIDIAKSPSNLLDDSQNGEDCRYTLPNSSAHDLSCSKNIGKAEGNSEISPLSTFSNRSQDINDLSLKVSQDGPRQEGRSKIDSNSVGVPTTTTPIKVSSKQSDQRQNEAETFHDSKILSAGQQSITDTDADQLEAQLPAEENLKETGVVKEEISSEQYTKDCDFSNGLWVEDDSHPLYKSENCPFLDGGFRCQENGRPDSDYLRWRWQPSQCDIPRFNSRDMLERLRGGRIVFVGDSIGRNHWESLICLLAEAVKNKSNIYEENGSPITKHNGFLSFRFSDYNCTIEYYRSPYLVPSSRAPQGSPSIVRSVLLLDHMDKTLRGGVYFQENSAVNLTMDVQEAFKRVIKTWGNWVKDNIDPQKTRVFFRSFSPSHFRGGTWKSGGRCDQETKPSIEGPEGEPWTNLVVTEEISRTNKIQHVISFLNITGLTHYRSDGHASVWYTDQGPAPRNREDCSHWCLPGVPDTWNEVLYAVLLAKGQGRWSNSPPYNPILEKV